MSDIENAKKELIKYIPNGYLIDCAQIMNGNSWDDEYDKIVNLKKNYSSEDYEKFLESLNFEYDSGYGSQELHGFVWFSDGSWMERSEYDGSEWWVHKSRPELPKELLN